MKTLQGYLRDRTPHCSRERYGPTSLSTFAIAGPIETRVAPEPPQGGLTPSTPADNASAAAAERAVLYASVEAFLACDNWTLPILRSLIGPTAYRYEASARSKGAYAAYGRMP